MVACLALKGGGALLGFGTPGINVFASLLGRVRYGSHRGLRADDFALHIIFIQNCNQNRALLLHKLSQNLMKA